MYIFSKYFFTDWEKENITEPPATKHISIDDLNNIATGEKDIKDFIPKVMCHSIGKNILFNYWGLFLIFGFFNNKFCDFFYSDKICDTFN